MRLKFYFLPLIAFLSIFLISCGDAKITLVDMETDLGKIEIEIYNEKAPLSAADFLYYVDNGLYDGQGFYRAVTPETDGRGLNMEIIQGGRLDLESVTASIDHETTEMTGLSHIDGAISMARDEPGTGSAAFFFISIGENTQLDYGGERNDDGQGYAVFGQIVKGMDVVRAIQQQETNAPTEDEYFRNQLLTKPVKIISAKRR